MLVATHLPAAVDTAALVTSTATGDIRHRCPFKDELDTGRITITWACDGATIELHSLAEYLKAYRDSEISHEELVDRIQLDLGTLDPRVTGVHVQATFTTAGMEVTVASAVLREPDRITAGP